MNILEQEDQLKGMPDSMLLMEMEQPSGMYPPFLVASEQQRRTPCVRTTLLQNNNLQRLS